MSDRCDARRVTRRRPCVPGAGRRHCQQAMKLVTWNVQWCRGCDGRVDPQRIVDDARAFADFDVLCLQEVAANFARLNRMFPS